MLMFFHLSSEFNIFMFTIPMKKMESAGMEPIEHGWLKCIQLVVVYGSKKTQ